MKELSYVFMNLPSHSSNDNYFYYEGGKLSDKELMKALSYVFMNLPSHWSNYN